MIIYLAGPLGFSEVGRLFHNDKIVKEITGLGHQILDPWSLTPQSEIAPILAQPYGAERKAAWQAKNVEIGERNREAIDRSDAVFAVLDGVDVDSGTAAEIGYAFARDKPIVGYRGDFRLSADNEGSIVNLQVEYFIRQSGGQIIDSIANLDRALEGLSPGKPVSGEASRSIPALALPAQLRRNTDQQVGAKLIISLLLALIVRAALEAIFKDPIQQSQPWPEAIVWCQLIVFVLLMVRFYLGATRFLDTQPKKTPLAVAAVNLIFASLIFGAFYVAGLAVAEDEFYASVVSIHGIDFVWFVVMFGWLFWSKPENMRGEVKVSSNKQVMLTFMTLSLATLALAAVLWGLFYFELLADLKAKGIFLFGVGLFSIFDFVYLRDYYFEHGDWIDRNKATV